MKVSVKLASTGTVVYRQQKFPFQLPKALNKALMFGRRPSKLALRVGRVTKEDGFGAIVNAKDVFKVTVFNDDITETQDEPNKFVDFANPASRNALVLYPSKTWVTTKSAFPKVLIAKGSSGQKYVSGSAFNGVVGQGFSDVSLEVGTGVRLQKAADNQFCGLRPKDLKEVGDFVVNVVENFNG